MQNIRLRTATDVLAAIPALLGFVPANSVVMIALTDHPRACREPMSSVPMRQPTTASHLSKP
ncbi:DUF4192 family protein [Rhodococcus sp. 1.20]|nr:MULTISPECIES: DUF4192 family protein [Rhodococcus]MCC4302024.1 DUF4192 domain-containing protein [Rhodococcus sp. 3-2]MDI9942723.1 DUF4192 family protein [Rhodococcus sp. IEGM 1302]WOI89236.1 DUF4192 family protein [Rhodococcus qingshengii]